VVIVPCLNEADNIRGTVAAILEVAAELPTDVTPLLIDDGSTDGTDQVIAELCDEHGCQAVYNPRNLGVGRSLLSAYETLEPGTWVTIMPGDNEIDFASIKHFVAIRHDYDLILGYLRNPIIRPLRRRLASFAYMRTVQTIYGFPYRYLNGMKLFRSEVFRGISVQASGHAFNSELLAKAILRDPDLRIGEAPFIARGRAAGTSKAIRPTAIARAIYEVGVGWQSVAAYRDKIIRGPRD
ncbi:MAG: glycosyltransferase family 2 protein, partial [Myxococcota bacterium]